MKRSALILLTAIYLLSCVGIGISRFYCCGKLASVNLTYATIDHADKNDCCKNEVKTFKVKDNHLNAVSFAFSELSAAILPVDYQWTILTITAEQINQRGYRANAPPGNLHAPIYTLNCAYRI